MDEVAKQVREEIMAEEDHRVECAEERGFADGYAGRILASAEGFQSRADEAYRKAWEEGRKAMEERERA
jgi:hypothetical protein